MGAGFKVWDSTRTPEPKFLQRQRGLAKDGSPWLTTLQNPRIPHSLVCPSPYSQSREARGSSPCKLMFQLLGQLETKPGPQPFLRGHPAQDEWLCFKGPAWRRWSTGHFAGNLRKGLQLAPAVTSGCGRGPYLAVKKSGHEIKQGQ